MSWSWVSYLLNFQLNLDFFWENKKSSPKKFCDPEQADENRGSDPDDDDDDLKEGELGEEIRKLRSTLNTTMIETPVKIDSAAKKRDKNRCVFSSSVKSYSPACVGIQTENVHSIFLTQKLSEAYWVVTVLKTLLFKAEIIALGKPKVWIAAWANSLSSTRKIEITGCESMHLKLCKARFVDEVKFNTQFFQYKYFLLDQPSG